ncbi:hypothetical protein [Paenibacillus luteus]|uniref:hypothetical protein n=1 Tax=Paenibacillus luteus TaxID=2545753 RepID=UPI00114187B3|nr:hypothetical protein [Paenibacillus luteus]
MSKMEVISPVTAIKAMEMKHKLTNGSTGGYTHYGLEEIKLQGNRQLPRRFYSSFRWSSMML